MPKAKIINKKESKQTPSSQNSTEGDDNIVMQLMQEFKSKSSRKQKQNETSFLLEAKSGFDAIPDQYLKKVSEAAAEVQALCERRFEERATINDAIRKTWLSILAEQERFEAIFAEIVASDMAKRERLEAGLDKALLLQRQACEEQSHAARRIAVNDVKGKHKAL